MSKFILSAATVIAFFIGTGSAWSYCAEPRAPSAPGMYFKPTKPRAPFCVNQLMRTHTCDDWEIDMYNSSVRRYRSEMEDYVQKLKSYVADAARYADDALTYAKCEINDLS